ncbi:SMI1/KNR4 family protein [Streptomyces sp. NPDC094448]|uniref:SMI1/KNR4 family protein n=1 Tax=Streptomyces sp. NPDC094448 TaxID=3366063 RepID=UPI00381137C1
MAAGTVAHMDMVAGIRGAVAGRAAAWDFIRAFAAEWSAAPLAEDDGCGAGEIAAAEERLGLRLPAALKEAYALLGRRPDLTDNHDALRPLAELEVEADERGAVLVFRDENQGVCRWGIPVTDPADPERDDPPVVVRLDLADKSDERWEPWLARVSHCFVEIVLAESVHEPEELTAMLDDDEGEEGDLAAEEGFARLPFPDYPPGDPRPTRWYAGPDLLVRGGSVVYVRARTEEALDLFLGPDEEG